MDARNKHSTCFQIIKGLSSSVVHEERAARGKRLAHSRCERTFEVVEMLFPARALDPIEAFLGHASIRGLDLIFEDTDRDIMYMRI